MVELFPYLMLWGECFSPRRAEELTGLTLSKKDEPGEIALRGRYKGQPRPYGAAEIEVPREIASARRLLWLLELSSLHLESLRKSGASTCHVHVDVRYWDQCNLEFEPEEVGRIAALGLAFTISCYDYSGREEPPELNR
jgi:hypothetical protein